MKRLFFITVVAFSLVACNQWRCEKCKTSNEEEQCESNEKRCNKCCSEEGEKQLNISILLDLSDRINPQKYPATPEHFQRDIENIKTITEFFKSDMERLGAYKAKGKIRVFFLPHPDDSEINSIAGKLKIDCSKMDNRGRKEVHDSITELFAQNLGEIYRQTIAQTIDWPGSDIWRFFKDDVKDFCIEKDSTYRNILIVFTDGYLYHKQSVQNNKNRFSYLLDRNLKPYRKSDWKQPVEQNDFGIMTERNDLNNLEVLVLEVSAENSTNKIDEDIISFVLKKWFEEMNVSRYEVYRSDLPANTKTRIENFLTQK